MASDVRKSNTMRTGDDLVRSADVKLYEAKRAGRDRVWADGGVRTAPHR